MSLFLTIFLIWVIALGFALLEGTLAQKKGKNLAHLVHLAFLGAALFMTSQAIWRLWETLRKLALSIN